MFLALRDLLGCKIIQADNDMDITISADVIKTAVVLNKPVKQSTRKPCRFSSIYIEAKFDCYVNLANYKVLAPSIRYVNR